MPYIRKIKKGMFPSLHGAKAYEYIEVDEQGVPVGSNRNVKSGTEPLIAPGIRAPDTAKGYSTPFDYHLYNKLRKLKKVR
jgi:hypothetical protein